MFFNFFDLFPTLSKGMFHVKIQHFVILFILKSDQDSDPDPHWFGSLDPYPDLDPH
jgi:hypothetical protein